MKKRIGRKPQPPRLEPPVQQIIGKNNAIPPLRLVGDDPTTEFNNWMLRLFNSIKERKESAAKSIRDLIALTREEDTNAKLPPDVATAILLEIFATALEPAIIAGNNLLSFVVEWKKRDSSSEVSAFITGLLSGSSGMNDHLYQTGLLTDGFGARLNLITMKLNQTRVRDSVDASMKNVPVPNSEDKNSETPHQQTGEQAVGETSEQTEGANGSEEGRTSPGNA